MSPTVSLVIVNYNGSDCLKECLESALRQSRPAEEVIVVDNHSADGSAAIAEAFADPRMRLIQLPDNRGYPAACNIGVRESSGSLVALLNNDILLDPDWLQHLLRRVTPEWSFWASRIVFADAPERVDSAGDGMAVVGAAYKIGHGGAASDYRRPGEVFGPCGAAAVYRRELLEQTGGMDEDFFLIHEDSDLSFRARLLGHRCLFVPEAVVHHRVNASIGSFSPIYVRYGHRNSEFVFWKNMPSSLLARYLPERLLFDLLSFLFFLWKGRGGAFLRGKFEFLRDFRGLWRKRRVVQQTRTLSPSQLRVMLDRNWFRFRRKAVKAP